MAINQIHHGGYLSKKIFSGLPPAVPSVDIANEILKKFGEEPIAREFTDSEIKKTIEDFANATELSIKAGYDGIEIHGANNNFIHLILIEELMNGGQ